MIREGNGSTRDLDDNDYNPSNVSGHDSGSPKGEPQNCDDSKACDSANEGLFSLKPQQVPRVAYC